MWRVVSVAGPAQHLVAAGVTTGEDSDVVDEGEGKGLGTCGLEESDDDWVFSEPSWVGGEVGSLHVDSLLLEGVDIGGEGHEFLVDIGAAYPGVATQCGLVDTDGGHLDLLRSH